MLEKTLPRGFGPRYWGSVEYDRCKKRLYTCLAPRILPSHLESPHSRSEATVEYSP